MPYSTVDLTIKPLFDTTYALREIESRSTARAFAAVISPEHGTEVRRVLDQQPPVLHAKSTDGDMQLLERTVICTTNSQTNDVATRVPNRKSGAWLHHVDYCLKVHLWQ